MRTRVTAGVLGVLVGVTCGAVAVAQAEPDYCRIQFQAAHEQYEQEVRTCNKQPSCLETAVKKFKAWKCITPAPGIPETPKMDPSAKPTTPIPPLRPETPQMAPTTNADCDRLRNNLTQAAENQYTNEVRACNRNPACL